ncbi:hypothetical protein [Lysinibacillus sp. Ag94]|uniref:hypothetical protein n=1 Tax=Lysinibacillus sp. Ag94 TaxID=2936682 RepID=UPI002010A3CC|nr:hypothetical protein [Lysinibacillus sp. Ag94]UPW82301.1 hypothetical protein MY533_16335 [Lysinibacillus sp. Ag94]
MAVKSGFLNKTFRNTTKERPDIVKVVASSEPKDIVVTVYERKNTLVIHSKNDSTNHASISKSKGDVENWELAYIVEHILKVVQDDVFMYTRGTGVIHIRTKEEVLMN